MRYAKSPVTGRSTRKMKGAGSAVGSGFGGRAQPKRVGSSISKAAKGRSGLATRRAKSGRMALGRKR